MEEEQMSFSTTLTVEEQSRMHPWTRAKCVIMSNRSPVFDRRSSYQSSSGYDLPDKVRPGHIIPVIPLATAGKFNHEQHIGAKSVKREERNTKWMEASSIAVEKVPSAESRPKIGQNTTTNGNIMMDKSYMNHENDDDACIKCIYITQQCCECVIT